MQKRTSVDEAFQKLERAVDEMIAARPKAKSGMLGWLKSKPYYDQALEAIKGLCTQMPALLKQYNASEGQSQMGFAASNVLQLMSLKSNFDTLDKKTWVPKVTDENTAALAQVFCEFLEDFMVANKEKQVFTSERKHADLDYQLVDKTPKDKEVSAGTIYLSEGKKGTYDFRYVSESDGSVIKGQLDASKISKYKDFLTDPQTFQDHIADTPSGTSIPMSDKLYSITSYRKQCPSYGVQDQLLDMHKQVRDNLKGQTAEAPKPN